jgi:protein TonB
MHFLRRDSFMQPSDISNDIDCLSPNDYTDGEGPGCEESMERVENRQTLEEDSYLKYAIVASCLLHLAVFVAVPSLVEIAPSASFLKPGEEVTPIRLVEFPTPQEKSEPAPDRASAMSDRDHKAVQQRIPKTLPGPRPLLGNILPPQTRIAALAPPMAPEELAKSREEKGEKESGGKGSPDRDSQKRKLSEGKKPFRSSAEKGENRKGPVDLRPTPKEIARALAGANGSADFYPEGDPDEAVVDIDTREDRFFSYLLHLKKKIEGVWTYPQVAARNGLGGELTVEFLVSNNGELLGVNLLDTSGYSILDESAMRAIRTAAPYHPFPSRLTAKRLRVRAKFIYITQSYFRRIM